MNYAAIDLGSNSFHILITSSTNEVLLRANIKTHIAQNLQHTGNIGTEAVARANLCLHKYKEYFDKYNVSKKIAVATAAFRQAQNGTEFIQQAEKILNIPIKIIDGKLEASLIYQGVLQHHNSQNPHWVIDIGGGSLEVIHGQEKEIYFSHSFDIGIVRIAETYFANDNINANDMEQSVFAVRKFISPILTNELQNKFPSKIAFGSSGAIACLSDLSDLLQLDHKTGTITKQLITNLAHKLTTTPISSLLLSDLPPKLNKLIPAGLAVLQAVFIILKLEKLEISTTSLCDGLIASLR